jgi:hypothetical protein
MVKFFLLGSQACFDIPEAFPIGKLGKCHAQVMVETPEFFDPEVALVTIDTTMKYPEWKIFQQLREDDFAGVHSQPPKKF